MASIRRAYVLITSGIAFQAATWAAIFLLRGLLDPGRYVRGLRRAVIAAGAQLLERSPVTRVEPGPTIVAHTEHGRVRARHLVVATNAYSSELRTKVPSVARIQVQLFRTAPLSPAQLASLQWGSRAGVYTAHEILERLSLDHLAGRPCAGLPYGTLKRIEFARALAGKPRLLMLDEPASGLTHGEVDELGALIRQIRDEFDLTVLLVEHHMSMVMAISEKIVVMDLGTKIAEGDPAAVRDDPAVISAYLGAST